MQKVNKYNSKNEISDSKTKSKVDSSKSILEAFEKILYNAKASNFDSKLLKKASPQISYASGILGLTYQQVILLAIFVDKSEKDRILLSDIAQFLGCSTTRILHLSKDVDVLVELNYLKASRSNRDISYRVPIEVLEALKNDSPFIPCNEEITNTTSFFEGFERMIKEKDYNEITYEEIKDRTEEMLSKIKDSYFAKELRKYNLDDEDKVLLIYMSYHFLANNDDSIYLYAIDRFFDDQDLPFRRNKDLRNGDSVLFDYNLIEYVNEDGLARTDAFKLTDFTKETLLSEIFNSNIQISQEGLIKYNTIPAKELIFNPDEETSVKELTSILSKERFDRVQERLEKASLKKGFCCLFYGTSGTGKTETVYQIAKRTGRNIMKVDVDKVRSCWVGQSEKNIKLLFDRYRNICKHSNIAPILLFNEADSIFGVRKEGAIRSIDKMENSIQNIILEEMDNLEGIMIATTNMNQNLDKAFERRFLYKIHYEKPTVEARQKIWEIMLPGISAEDAHSLSTRFDMSGGEIENIARKHTVNAILSGDETIDLEKILEMCQKERIASKTQQVCF